jgi:hypothetical protein
MSTLYLGELEYADPLYQILFSQVCPSVFFELRSHITAIPHPHLTNDYALVTYVNISTNLRFSPIKSVKQFSLLALLIFTLRSFLLFPFWGAFQNPFRSMRA